MQNSSPTPIDSVACCVHFSKATCRQQSQAHLKNSSHKNIIRLKLICLVAIFRKQFTIKGSQSRLGCVDISVECSIRLLARLLSPLSAFMSPFFTFQLLHRRLATREMLVSHCSFLVFLLQDAISAFSPLASFLVPPLMRSCWMLWPPYSNGKLVSLLAFLFWFDLLADGCENSFSALVSVLVTLLCLAVACCVCLLTALSIAVF